MKVELKHVQANPFRNLPHYPIDKAKIAKLKSSIKRTGFWDNLVARKASGNGSVEIAYGHHRRQALLDMYPASHEIEVILRDLGDADMIKVMADENDEVFNMTPAVINETVKAARDYLHSLNGQAEYKKLVGRAGLRAGEQGSKVDAPVVAEFLDWDLHRVEEALAEIGEIEDPKLSESDRAIKKEIIEKMPTQNAAREFRQQASKHKAPIKAQREVASRVHKGEVGTSEIAPRLIEASFKRKEAEKRKQFTEFLDDTRDKMNAATTALGRLAKFRKDLEGPIYGNTTQRRRLVLSCDRLVHAIAEVFGKSAVKQLKG